MFTDVDNIPLVDLQQQHQQIAEEIDASFQQVMRDNAFVLGPQVRVFEESYASYTDAGHCVAVANGTDALELALRASGVRAGDEVIVPANTFIATAEAVCRLGARPVFADCDPRTYLLDVGSVAERVTAATAAIIPVHLYGQSVPLEELEPIAGSVAAVIVEDAAQAQGARRHGVPVGALGAAAATSFYPGKNLGAYGDAGAVITNNAELAETVRQLGNHGQERKYEHAIVGMNSRMDTLQAVVLQAKLRHLDAWNAERRRAAACYDEMLADLSDVVRPVTLPANEHVWHLYVVQVPQRDNVLRTIQAAGIGAGVHYPVPVHLQRAFQHLKYRRGSMPNAEFAADRILSLPLFPGITAPQQERVVDELRKALR